MAQSDCPICGGTGWKTVERRAENESARGGARASSIDGAGAGAATAAAPRTAADSRRQAAGAKSGVWAVPCDCTGKDRTSRVLARARIPSRYEHCDFDSFDTGLYAGVGKFPPSEAAVYDTSIEQARLVTEAFARNYPVGTDTGLLIMGKCGAGKTHLAVAALRQIVLRGHTGLFYDYRELLKEIQGSYNAVSQTSELGVLEPVLTADVLLLDDLGSSKPSPWAMETVGHILNTRYNEKRVTIITTNYLDDSTVSPPSLASAPPAAAARTLRLPSGQAVAPSKEDSLTDRLGMRIRSRLYEMCRTVEVVAPDYRQAIRNAGRVRT